MKRLLSIFIAASLVFGSMAFSVSAIEPADQDFQQFLQEVDMTEQEFSTYLSDFHDYSIQDFDTVEELKDYLGPVLNDQNLQDLLEEFEITIEDLEELFAENDSSLSDYVFYDDLYYAVSDWLYVESLTPINDDSIEQLLLDYEFASRDELEAFLNKHDDSIENYEYIEDLDFAVAEYMFMDAKDDVINTLDSFGLSLAEANKLANHAMKVIDNQEDPEQFFMQLEEISDRLMNFPEFESASELSAEDIAEMLSIWNDLLNLLDLKIEYSLVKDGKETAISFPALMEMTSTGGADLLIKIFSSDGEFLADMVVTKDMFGSDFLEETAQNLDNTNKAVQEASDAAEKIPAEKAHVKTVKGGKLPNTASNYLPNALTGLALIIAGSLLFRRMKAKGV